MRLCNQIFYLALFFAPWVHSSAIRRRSPVNINRKHGLLDSHEDISNKRQRGSQVGDLYAVPPRAVSPETYNPHMLLPSRLEETFQGVKLSPDAHGQGSQDPRAAIQHFQDTRRGQEHQQWRPLSPPREIHVPVSPQRHAKEVSRPHLQSSKKSRRVLPLQGVTRTPGSHRQPGSLNPIQKYPWFERLGKLEPFVINPHEPDFSSGIYTDTDKHWYLEQVVRLKEKYHARKLGKGRGIMIEGGTDMMASGSQILRSENEIRSGGFVAVENVRISIEERGGGAFQVDLQNLLTKDLSAQQLVENAVDHLFVSSNSRKIIRDPDAVKGKTVTTRDRPETIDALSVKIFRTSRNGVRKKAQPETVNDSFEQARFTEDYMTYARKKKKKVQKSSGSENPGSAQITQNADFDKGPDVALASRINKHLVLLSPPRPKQKFLWSWYMRASSKSRRNKSNSRSLASHLKVIEIRGIKDEEGIYIAEKIMLHFPMFWKGRVRADAPSGSASWVPHSLGLDGTSMRLHRKSEGKELDDYLLWAGTPVAQQFLKELAEDGRMIGNRNIDFVDIWYEPSMTGGEPELRYAIVLEDLPADAPNASGLLHGSSKDHGTDMEESYRDDFSGFPEEMFQLHDKMIESGKLRVESIDVAE